MMTGVRGRMTPASMLHNSWMCCQIAGVEFSEKVVGENRFFFFPRLVVSFTMGLEFHSVNDTS